MVSNILWRIGRLAKGVNTLCVDQEGWCYLGRQALALYWSDSGLFHVQGWHILIQPTFPVDADNS